MKLQLLIPQFNETDDIVRQMLDSINIQQGVDLENDIEVIFGNDGSDIKLSETLLTDYPFSVRYMHFDHSGLPGTRKNLFENSNADYVMFCDADDLFLSPVALYIIFKYLDGDHDAILCNFMEEIIDRKTRKSVFVEHKKDKVFVHGKIYKRQFLIDNNIVWHPDVTCHEDSGYNFLAIALAKNIKWVQTPLYLWKWRDNSICRKDPLYVPKTYTRMIYSNECLVKDLLDRGLDEKAKYFVCMLTYGTYYMLNKPIWLDPTNVQYRYTTEKCFSNYYKKHYNLFASADNKVRNYLIRGTKLRTVREGVLLERFTFDEWIAHIQEL